MTLADSENAYLRSELGEADRTDLGGRYLRHGRGRQVLRERKTALAADPLAVTVQGVPTVNHAENAKAIERQIASIEDRRAEGGFMPLPVPLMRPRRR
ncbi:hypothetical protein [Streptomyces coeruleorubidus]